MASAQASEGAGVPESTTGIDAVPQVGQNITHNGSEYTTIKEGLAYILVPRGTPTSTDPKMSKEDTQKQQVFYNPIQQFNRDLSVLAIKTFGEDLVERRRQKHEHARRKAERQGEKRKRKLGENGNSDDQNETGASNDVVSKRRKTTQNDAQTPEIGHLEASKDAVDDVSVNVAESGHGGQGDGATHKDQDHHGWSPSFSILDALSATGLRALRYAKEIPFSTSITANDLSSKATEAIKLNVQHNKLDSKIKPNTGNALVHMYSFAGEKGYDVIDLDPYGTAAPFIDAAIQAINHDGLVCVTCTDSAIFASHGYLEKTYSQYGGLPLKGEPCHEGGLRLLLHAIGSSAGRYGMSIEPLLSLSIDYYIRVFVRVRKSPNDVKMLAGKTMIVYHCQNGCGSWSTQYLAKNKPKQNRDGTSSYKYSFAQAPSADKLCEHCGTKTHLSGPMYGGPLHNVGFIQRVLAQLNEVDSETYPTRGRIEGMLHTALEEITFGAQAKDSTKPVVPEQLDPLIPKVDPATLDEHPFFFIPSAVARVVHCSAPSSAAMRGALRHAGFKATMSHCKPGSIRTDAPWTAIWHIMLEWIRQRQPLKNQLRQGTAGYAILSKATAHHVSQKSVEEKEVKTADAENSETVPTVVVDDAKNELPSTSAKLEQPENARPCYLGTDFEVVFDEKLGRDPDRGKYVRYQTAPRENWGPMARAK